MFNLPEPSSPQDYKKHVKYIKTRSQKLPFGPCFASAGWFEGHGYELTVVIVSRRMPRNRFCFAGYMIDKGCLGLKSTLFRVGYSEEEYKTFVRVMSEREERPYEEITVQDAHNLIFGGIDYAEDNGFQPMDKDWNITKHLLDERQITDGIDRIQFGGENGKPLYISGPHDNVEKIIAQLRRRFGEGGFNYVMGGPL